MAEALFKLNNIKKNFGSVQALCGVGFEVEKGLITAIVGDNGSGKSTLIKIISGNLLPDEGTIEIGGAVYNGLNIRQAIDLGVRTVYQDLSLDNCKNSWENVFLGRERMRGPFLDRKAMKAETAALIDRLEIRIQDLDVPVRMLSGGQRQGLAIARTLLEPGKVLLLDEPTAAMGIKESHNTLQLLMRLREGGATILWVSHNLHQVFDIADRVIVMRSGQVIAEARTAESSPEAVQAMILAKESEVEGE